MNPRKSNHEASTESETTMAYAMNVHKYRKNGASRKTRKFGIFPSLDRYQSAFYMHLYLKVSSGV